MTRTLASLLLGVALGVGMVGTATAAEPAASVNVPPGAVYGLTHAEGAITDALASSITRGRIRIEFDTPTIELRAPADGGPLHVEHLYYNPVNNRFAADLVVDSVNASIRQPVAGRAYGVVQVPVLNRRVAVGEVISDADVSMMEMRADGTDMDLVSSDADLVGRSARRALQANQPIHSRDIQTPRLVDKGALVTIVLRTPQMQISAQGRALVDGGKGDVIRVVNTQTNRVVEVTVVGSNQVAAGQMSTPAF